MHYGDDTSTSISTYYFEAKSRDEDNYKAIIKIFAVSIMLPFATFIAFVYIAFCYSNWIADYTTTYVKGNYEQDDTPKEKEPTDSSSKEKELSSLKRKKCASVSDSLQKDVTAVQETPITSSPNDATCSELSLCQADDMRIQAIKPSDDKIGVTLAQEDQQIEQKVTKQKKENSSDGEERHRRKKREEELANYWSRTVNVVALSITFLILSIALFIFHILASIKLIHYGNEVLYDDNDDRDSRLGGNDGISNNDYNLTHDDQCVPIVYTAVSFLPFAILIICSLVAYLFVTMQFLCSSERFKETCCAKCFKSFCNLFNRGDADIEVYKNTTDESNGGITNPLYGLTTILEKTEVDNFKKAAQRIAEISDTNDTLGLLFQVSFGGFLVYLGFYFLPYMALAFINDPIQTIFIYLIGASFAFSIFTIIKAVLSYTAIKIGWLCSTRVKTHLILVTATGISIAYFLIIFLFILTLGNFHDFKAIENLTIPIIIGLLSLFVIKPAIKYVKIEAKKENLELLHL